MRNIAIDCILDVQNLGKFCKMPHISSSADNLYFSPATEEDLTFLQCIFDLIEIYPLSLFKLKFARVLRIRKVEGICKT